MNEKVCEICGITFTSTRANQKYCPGCGKHSDREWAKFNQNLKASVARAGNGYIPEYQNACKYCGKVFTSKCKPADYCSTYCKEEYTIASTKCLYCGKTMPEVGAHEYIKGKRWYCSSDCKKKDAWRTAREMGNVHVCLECKKEFIRSGDASYCSMNCYNTAKDNGRYIRKKEQYPAMVKVRCAVCGTLCDFEFSKIEKGIMAYCSDACREVLKKRSEELHRKRMQKPASK